MHHVDRQASVLSPSIKLSPPLFKKSDGHYNEEAGSLVRELEAGQECCRLHGLTEAHLIGQNSTKALVVQIPHPNHSLTLVMIQTVVDRAGKLDVRRREMQRANLIGDLPFGRCFRWQGPTPLLCNATICRDDLVTLIVGISDLRLLLRWIVLKRFLLALLSLGLLRGLVLLGLLWLLWLLCLSCLELHVLGGARQSLCFGFLSFLSFLRLFFGLLLILRVLPMLLLRLLSFLIFWLGVLLKHVHILSSIHHHGIRARCTKTTFVRR
mmetsp:Transcript_11971/g.28594  ORF Transcript_11971/g.28594 Transcript_11971/m.28594 type:complete len:267 (+) Transcript_11971:2088-2888(+)